MNTLDTHTAIQTVIEELCQWEEWLQTGPANPGETEKWETEWNDVRQARGSLMRLRSRLDGILEEDAIEHWIAPT